MKLVFQIAGGILMAPVLGVAIIVGLAMILSAGTGPVLITIGVVVAAWALSKLLGPIE